MQTTLTEVYSPTMIGADGTIIDGTNAAQDNNTFYGGGTAVLDGNALMLDNAAAGDRATVSVSMTNASTIRAQYRMYISVEPASEVWQNALDIQVNGTSYSGITAEVVP